MFHVKLTSRRAGPWASQGGLVVAGLLLSAGAQAAVFRCTGADGKVAFSDQPCSVGQTGGAVRGPTPASGASPAASKPAGPTAAPTSADSSAAARQAAAARIRASLSPECRDLTEQMQRFALEGAGNRSEADTKALIDRTERQCGDALRRATEAENARNEAARRAEQRQSECQAQRRVLDERRPRLASLPAADRAAFDQLEQQVARDCR